jgi:ribonucleotide monophosphatase NagD (HAD superfamily)
LSKELSFKKKIYVIGSESLKKELKENNLNVFQDDHSEKKYDEEEMSTIKVDEEIGCVLIGYESKFNNFKMVFHSLFSLVKAYAHQIFQQNKECLYLVTNEDATLPYGKYSFFFK